jgi:hypothetical protein
MSQEEMRHFGNNDRFLGIIAESGPIGWKLPVILFEVRYVEAKKAVGSVGRYSHFRLAVKPAESHVATAWEEKPMRGIYLSRYQATNNADEKTMRDRVRYYKSQGINTIIQGVWGNGCTMYNRIIMQLSGTSPNLTLGLPRAKPHGRYDPPNHRPSRHAPVPLSHGVPDRAKE